MDTVQDLMGSGENEVADFVQQRTLIVDVDRSEERFRISSCHVTEGECFWYCKDRGMLR